MVTTAVSIRILKLATSIAPPIALELIAQMVKRVQLDPELHAQLAENTSARMPSQPWTVSHVTSKVRFRSRRRVLKDGWRKDSVGIALLSLETLLIW
ncbi:hypothetical protein EAF00_002500 [Botryotinia globosa]|nr:hypothetical protein EAF00_002500 [Botryotinia globosa]